MILAEKLLSLENGGFPFYENLRKSLPTLIGIDGYYALARRALELGKSKSPGLQGLSVERDGSIEGLSDLPPECAAEVVAKLLELLVAFVGEPLTARIVMECWPDERSKS